MTRQPAVAGQFYYETATKLKKQVEQYIVDTVAKEKAIGIVSPHAGLMYSGHVAGAVYSSIQFPDTFILLGPNHTGLGARVSIMSSGEWEIPTGVFTIDENLAKKIKQKAPHVVEDVQAHIFEHSLEVQLPFISYFSDKVKIVPIAVMRADIDECRAIGKGIAQSIKETGCNVVIAASSDMSHYVPDDIARKLDGLAIDKMLSLDPEGLYSIVEKERISMCGFLPATIMLCAAIELGATSAQLIKYATSGDISGDYEHVVGYAGIVIK
ncbi:MAG: AmmeMemoRadiSam system protein B [Thermodesulfovibrionales bacterium]|nr:AmmeMemoRadiSam system protein B [Thermodesulfovibrionales bacterium]